MLLSAVFVLAAGVSETVEIQLPQGPHPHVFLTPQEAEAVRARAESQDWARRLRDSFEKSADDLAAAPLEFPREGGQWSHWYSCKIDGGSLEAKSPTLHVCKTCGAEYTGWPYDQVYITRQHHRWMRGIEDLGVAYVLDPKPEYAQRVRDILLGYAAFYETLPIHNKDGKESRSGGRLYAQTLDESVTLCSLALGYDMVYDAPCFTPEDHAVIAEKLIRPMVDTIKRNDAGISNWQSWHNAGIGAAGFVIGDRDLVEHAINGPHGFLFQMRESVTPSGMWYEESPSYHWYALSAHIYLLEAATRAGVDLYTLPVVKSMFDAPVAQVYPDLTFPAINDSNRSSITGARSYYEIAYARYGDPQYLALLTARDSQQALLWGVDALPEIRPEALPLETVNLEGDGLAMLRAQDRELTVVFDYGPGKSGHVHPAKLQITLFAHGDERFVDPGRLPYGNPLHREWYTQTIAHNTVTVNGESQRRTGAKLKRFENTDTYALIQAETDSAYEGVQLERTVLLAGSTVIDVFRCASPGADATFDLPLHIRATLQGLPDGTPAELYPDASGYNRLADTRKLEPPVQSFVADCGAGKRIHITFLDGAETYAASGFGYSPRESVPLVTRRQNGKDALFVSVYQVLDTGNDAKAVAYDAAAGTVTSGEVTLSLEDLEVSE